MSARSLSAVTDPGLAEASSYTLLPGFLMGTSDCVRLLVYTLWF
jgi:hypothetical protein